MWSSTPSKLNYRLGPWQDQEHHVVSNDVMVSAQEAYLEPCQLSIMERLGKNGQRF